MKKTIIMEELRAIQLGIFDKIHAFCTERGIRYSLGGGTLLGAVRHKGYIPWDDDIDIMLPRPDYDRFLKGFEGKYAELNLQYYGNDITCCIPFAKVYDNRTVLIEKLQKSGIYIDVFPIDGLPEESKIKDYLSIYNNQLHKIYFMTPFYKITGSLKDRMKYYVKKVVYPTRDKYIMMFYDFLKSYSFEKSENAGAICGIYAEKELMPRETFESYITVEFEGRQYMAIKDYDAYLAKHYGDYMQFPPKEKQVSHHVFTAYWK